MVGNEPSLGADSVEVCSPIEMSHSQEFLSCKYSVPVPWNSSSVLKAGSLTLGVVDSGKWNLLQP